jgi:hypothetical protein
MTSSPSDANSSAGGEAVRPTLRADGVTRSERTLQRLCERSFLKLWSYVGVYRDQGKRGSGDGKEVCDVMVVFGNDVVLFSDKECAFPDTGDLETDWNRWKRRAITKSAEQLWGAERWIREHPERLYLDRACMVPFPLPLPTGSAARVHRVIVARGAGPRCAAQFKASPSLPLYSCELERLGKEHGKALPPFAITPMGSRSEVVHIFDDHSLDVVLQTLDTISDFLRYLERKEVFVSSSAFASAAGEEELLSFYLQNWNKDADLDFTLPDVHGLGQFGQPTRAHLADGGWNELIASESWQAWRAFNAPSFVWDEIIASFADHAFAGTLWSSDDPSIRFHERILRIMASETRARRRMLSIALVEHFQRSRDLDRSGRVIPGNRDEPHYVFVSAAMEEGEGHDEYRTRRRELITQYAAAAKHWYPDARDVLAIGMEPLMHNGHSYDIVLIDGSDWSDEEAATARMLVEEGGILSSLDPPRRIASERDLVQARLEVRVMETAHNDGTGRNDSCPCGSGKKFKKCHGRNA